MWMRPTCIAIFLTLAAAGALAQPKNSRSLLDAIEARLRDAENAATIASEGRLLYQADENTKSWAEYCVSSVQLSLRGEFREAVRAASKAFFLGESEGSAIAKAFASRDLSFAFSLAGDLEQAWYWTEQALRFSAGAGSSQSTVLAVAHRVRGDIEFKRAAFERAVKEYEIAIYNADRPGRRFIQLALARAELKRGNTAKAAEVFADLRNEENALLRSTALRGEAEIAVVSGKADEARRLYADAAKIVDERKAPLTAMWFRLGLARAMLSLGERAPAAAEARKAVSLAERVGARFRSEEFRTGFFGEVQEVYELAIEIAMDDGRYAEAFELSEMSRARSFTDLIRGRIKHSGVMPEQKLDAAAIAAALPPGTALVVYHVFPKRTAAWVLRAEGRLSGQWLPVGMAPLGESSKLFRKQITEFSAVQDQAGVLYAQLIAPLNLQENETVVFVPHKSLHFLPFQALRGPKGWLIEERALAAVPSASALVTMVRKPSIPADSLLALGNPLLAKNDLPPLPGAEIEIERIAPQFSTATKYLRDTATRARVLTEANGKSVLHIAAHAQVDDIDPMYSRIRLATSDKGQSDLEAHDLYRVNLGEARLVTLSACDSGLGRVSGGEEFWGFKRTVLGAGARTLLASLWPVADESTPILMTRFYEGLKKMSGAEALRAGQLELIRSKEFSHPFFWAPFILTGDWR